MKTKTVTTNPVKLRDRARARSYSTACLEGTVAYINIYIYIYILIYICIYIYMHLYIHMYIDMLTHSPRTPHLAYLIDTGFPRLMQWHYQSAWSISSMRKQPTTRAFLFGSPFGFVCAAFQVRHKLVFRKSKPPPKIGGGKTINLFG